MPSLSGHVSQPLQSYVDHTVNRLFLPSPVITRDDLRQSAYLALLQADDDRLPYYGFRIARHAIHAERRRFRKPRWVDCTLDQPASIVLEADIQHLIDSMNFSDLEKRILQDKILGGKTAREVAKELDIDINKVYRIERALKQRIKEEISGV